LPAQLPTPSSTLLSLEDLRELLDTRPAAIVLGPVIAAALSGKAVVLKDLLQSGLRLAFDNIGINEKLKQQVLPNLDSFDLLRGMRIGALLETLIKSKKGLLAEWLRDAIGPPTVANPAVANPLLKASQDGFALASATYDGLLESVIGLKSMTWLEFHGLSQLLTPPTLLRLYGSWNQPDSIVRALPGASGAELHRRAIGTFLHDLRFFLAVGAAIPLGDDPLVEGLKRRGDTLPGVILCRDDEVGVAQQFLAEHLPWFRIAPYSGGNEALPKVLASLFGNAPSPDVAGFEPKPLPNAPREPRILVPDAGSEVLDLAYASIQGLIVTGQVGGKVQVWDSEGSLVRSENFEEQARIWSVASHSKFHTAAAGDESGALVWFFPERGKSGFSGNRKSETGIWSLAFDHTSERLAAARDSGHVETWMPWKPFTPESQSHPYKRYTYIHAHAQGALAVAFSPDGQTLASAGHDRTIRFWSVPDLKPLRAFEGHDDWVGSIAFSPDGKTLASTGGDKTVILWDLETGQPRWRAHGHTEWIQSLSFHRSGELISTGSWDKTVRIWNVANGQLLKTFDGHTARVWTVAFSPDGAWLASGGDDHTVRLWPIDVAELETGTPPPVAALPADFIDLTRNGDRLCSFLARLPLRHLEALPLLETLEPGNLSDVLRSTTVLAAPNPAEFARRVLELEQTLGTKFRPPSLWMAWMVQVRGAEVARLSQELLSLADRAVETSQPAAALSPALAEAASVEPDLESTSSHPAPTQKPSRKSPRRKPPGKSIRPPNPEAGTGPPTGTWAA